MSESRSLMPRFWQRRRLRARAAAASARSGRAPAAAPSTSPSSASRPRSRACAGAAAATSSATCRTRSGLGLLRLGHAVERGQHHRHEVPGRRAHRRPDLAVRADPAQRRRPSPVARHGEAGALAREELVQRAARSWPIAAGLEPRPLLHRALGRRARAPRARPSTSASAADVVLGPLRACASGPPPASRRTRCRGVRSAGVPAATTTRPSSGVGSPGQHRSSSARPIPCRWWSGSTISSVSCSIASKRTTRA